MNQKKNIPIPAKIIAIAVFTAGSLAGALEGETGTTPDKLQEHCEQIFNTHINCLKDSSVEERDMPKITGDDISMSPGDCVKTCLNNSAMNLTGNLEGLKHVVNNVCLITDLRGVFYLPVSFNVLCEHASGREEFWDCKLAVWGTSICGLPSLPSSD